MCHMYLCSVPLHIICNSIIKSTLCILGIMYFCFPCKAHYHMCYQYQCLKYKNLYTIYGQQIRKVPEWAKDRLYTFAIHNYFLVYCASITSGEKKGKYITDINLCVAMAYSLCFCSIKEAHYTTNQPINLLTTKQHSLNF